MSGCRAHGLCSNMVCANSRLRIGRSLAAGPRVEHGDTTFALGFSSFCLQSRRSLVILGRETIVFLRVNFSFCLTVELSLLGVGEEERVVLGFSEQRCRRRPGLLLVQPGGGVCWGDHGGGTPAAEPFCKAAEGLSQKCCGPSPWGPRCRGQGHSLLTSQMGPRSPGTGHFLQENSSGILENLHSLCWRELMKQKCLRQIGGRCLWCGQT